MGIAFVQNRYADEIYLKMNYWKFKEMKISLCRNRYNILAV